MGSESRLQPGIVACHFFLDRRVGKEGRSADIWIMEPGRDTGCVIGAYHKYPRLTNGICLFFLFFCSLMLHQAPLTLHTGSHMCTCVTLTLTPKYSLATGFTRSVEKSLTCGENKAQSCCYPLRTRHLSMHLVIIYSMFTKSLLLYR